MITYNHEKYIEQAVRSVMMQETDFGYELVIGEDCSTDKTREIVLRLKDEFPAKIRLVLSEQNIGMIPNMIATYNACQGEYIALCEGDDYWTDTKKLQIQADYLDTQSNCRLCFHSAKVHHQDGIQDDNVQKPPTDHKVNFDNWLKYRTERSTYIATATVVFRAVNEPLPGWYSQLQFAGDWPLIVWLAQSGGNLVYLDTKTPMTVYRKHSGGVTHRLSLGTQLRDYSDHILVLKYVDSHWRRYLRKRLYRISLGIYRTYLTQHECLRAIEYLAKAGWYVDFKRIQDVSHYLKIIFKMFFYPLYSRVRRIKTRLTLKGE